MDWQTGWMGKAVRILIQRVQIPLEAAFFLLFKTLDVNFVQKCQICVEKEKPDWLFKPDRKEKFFWHNIVVRWY